MIKAIIFNFGGTVLDTETPRYKAFHQAYREQGMELDWSRYAQCIGTGLQYFNPYEYLLERMKLPIQLDAFRNSIRSHYSSLMEQEELLPGVMDILVRARALGLKTGLVSSSSKRLLEPYLQKLNLHRYFDCIRTGDDVSKLTPDPELYRQTLRLLGVKPRQTMAIEDSPMGVQAAAAAGLYTIAVPNRLTAKLKFGPVHERIASLEELELPALLTGLQTTIARVQEPVVLWNRVIPIDNQVEVC